MKAPTTCRLAMNAHYGKGWFLGYDIKRKVCIMSQLLHMECHIVIGLGMWNKEHETHTEQKTATLSVMIFVHPKLHPEIPVVYVFCFPKISTISLENIIIKNNCIISWGSVHAA